MSDVVQHSFYGGGGKLSKSIVKAVFVHGQPLPVDIASLEKSQAVPLQAVVVPGFAVLIEKERTQDVDRKSTRLNSSHQPQSRMPSSA